MQALHAATRYPATDYWQGRHDRGRPADVEGSYSKNSKFVDPWLEVCGRCPADDCVVPEGLLNAGGKRSIALYAERGCAVYKARQRGWDAGMALKNWQALGLLEEW